MRSIEPSQVLGDPNVVLVDLRPFPERYGSIGFIPGSIGLPPADPPGFHQEQVRRVAGAHTPVFVCMSGSRARDYIEALGPHCADWGAYLDGGVLAWAAQGLPLCGRDNPGRARQAQPPHDDLPRQLVACFVGEMADHALDHGLDPVLILRDCFERSGQNYDAPVPEQLHRVIDHAALFSLRIGTPLGRIAANIDHMLSLLPEPAHRQCG